MAERDAIRKQIEVLTNTKSAENYESRLWRFCQRNSLDYADVAYEFVGGLHSAKSKEERVQLMRDLESGKSIWETSIYSKYKNAPKPLQIKDIMPDSSEFVCKNPKCRSKKCYPESHQTRSRDEGMTNFVICAECLKRFKLN